jgi:hypothetical protein
LSWKPINEGAIGVWKGKEITLAQSKQYNLKHQIEGNGVWDPVHQLVGNESQVLKEKPTAEACISIHEFISGCNVGRGSSMNNC